MMRNGDWERGTISTQGRYIFLETVFLINVRELLTDVDFSQQLLCHPALTQTAKCNRKLTAKALRETPSEFAAALRCEPCKATRWLFEEAGASLHVELDRPAAWAAPESAHGWTRNVAISVCYAGPRERVVQIQILYNLFANPTLFAQVG
eukprot:1185035-Prorocentrum_minimum.AAC.5